MDYNPLCAGVALGPGFSHSKNLDTKQPALGVSTVVDKSWAPRQILASRLSSWKTLDEIQEQLS